MIKTSQYFILLIVSFILLSFELNAQQLKPIKLDNHNAWLMDTKDGVHAELSIAFPFGSQHDPEGMYGAAYFLGKLLSINKAWTLIPIHSKILIPTNTWIRMSATVKQDRFILHIGFPIAHIKGIANIIKSLLDSQQLDSEYFYNAKENLLLDIKKSFSSLKSSHLRYLLVNTIEPNRWHIPDYGTIASISDMKKSDILSFMKEVLKQDKVEFFLTGNLVKESAEKFIDEVFNVLPDGISKYLENPNHLIPLKVKLPGYVERIKSPDATSSVVFTFKTPGWSSPNFLITWMMFKSFGCKKDGWLFQQLRNMVENAVKEASLCWTFGENEGLAKGSIILSKKSYSSVVYRSLLALLLNISNKGVFNKDWLTLGRDTLKAEWGVLSMKKSFNYSYISEFLPITNAVWNPDELAKAYNKSINNTLPNNVTSIFSPDNIHVLIIK